MKKKDQVIAAFEHKYGKEYRVFFAPGRINIIGEHTDYNNGFVLPAAIDKCIYLAIQPIAGNTTYIHSVDFDEEVSFTLDVDHKTLPHWALYPFGVIKELQKLGKNSGAFRAAFGGDIPEGAGLSSSAALESVFATALNSLFDFGLDKMTLAKTGQMAEHNYAGVMCGIMDQFASIHGKKGHVMKLDCRSLEFEYFPLELGEYELLLIDTRVKHSLASSEYNSRRKDCEEGVMIMRRDNSQRKSLRDVRSKDVITFLGSIGEQVYMRCQFVTEEIERVGYTCESLLEGDLEQVGRYMFETHEGLSRLYHVSCPELDLLADVAAEIPGVLGARMMGGGFGGCTINLVKSTEVPVLIETTRKKYLDAFGKEPEYYKVNTGDGAGEII